MRVGDIKKILQDVPDDVFVDIQDIRVTYIHDNIVHVEIVPVSQI